MENKKINPEDVVSRIKNNPKKHLDYFESFISEIIQDLELKYQTSYSDRKRLIRIIKKCIAFGVDWKLKNGIQK